jgi:ATP-dependent Clp protease ATP-binding subunit ClpA
MREMDFGDYNEKLSKSGREVLALAIEESRQRDQNYLAAEHLFLALVKIERKLYEDIVSDMHLDPGDIVKDVKRHLDLSKQYAGKGLKITFSMKSIFRLAWINAFQSGRSKIESHDLFVAIFQEGNNIPVEIFRLHKAEPEKIVEISSQKVGGRVSSEQLVRKFDLPFYLKRFTTNLNRLARQNSIPAVPDRESEVRQVLEAINQTDPPHSILLIDDTESGAIATVDEVARKLELEGHLLPENQRALQILELHLSNLTPGERLLVPLENMISELEERKDLVLFVPDLHILLVNLTESTMPAEARSVFWTALLKNKIRVIGIFSQNSFSLASEKDQAFAHAFQTVAIKATSAEVASEIIKREEKIKASVRRRLSRMEFGEDRKQIVRDAVAAGDFEKAFYVLSEYYEQEDKDPTKIPIRQPSKLFVVSALIVFLFILFFLILAIM